MIVTALEPREGTAFAVFVEGEYALTLDAETIARAHLRPGREVDREALNELRRDGERRRARERALYLLGVKSYTHHELVDKLTADYDPAVALETAGRMAELGLVDDAAYARRFARARAEGKGFGPQRIRQELLRKGVDRDLVDGALEELSEEFDADEKLLEVIRRKYMRSLGDPKGVQRTVAALTRLGYRYGAIREALDTLRLELPDEEPYPGE